MPRRRKTPREVDERLQGEGTSAEDAPATVGSIPSPALAVQQQQEPRPAATPAQQQQPRLAATIAQQQHSVVGPGQGQGEGRGGAGGGFGRGHGRPGPGRGRGVGPGPGRGGRPVTRGRRGGGGQQPPPPQQHNVPQNVSASATSSSSPRASQFREAQGPSMPTLSRPVQPISQQQQHRLFPVSPVQRYAAVQQQQQPMPQYAAATAVPVQSPAEGGGGFVSGQNVVEQFGSLQIQQLQSPQVQELPGGHVVEEEQAPSASPQQQPLVAPPPVSSKSLRFSLRPGRGQMGQKCIVKANHFFAELPDNGQRVHQLWPPEDVVCSTNFDVVLFHGLQRQGERDAWKSTWVQRNDPHNCWAQNWLPQDLGENVRVLAPSYDSCIVQCGNQGNTDDVSEIARNILQTLVISDRWRLGQRYGFVMIGHCFGGLVIKSLMEEAQKGSQWTPRNNFDRKVVASATKFLQNLKGIVFYAVPHLGSELQSYFTRSNSTWFANGVKWAGIFQNLRSHQSRMADLSQSCDDIISQFSINVFAFLEGTTIPNMKRKLVEKPGARCHARHNYYVLEDCDHFNVCKPPDKKHASYQMLLTVIKDCREQKEQQIYVGRPSWQFCYFVESRLVPMLQENLMDVVSKYILVHGNLGCGKTSLVEYVIQRYAEDLLNRFSGGIYKLQYGTDDCDNIKLLTSQKGLLRELTPADHEIESMSIATVQSKLRRQLKMCPGPWLLFIDDVWSVKSISQSPEPIGDSCKLVLTSRFELKDLPATRVKIDEKSNHDIAAQLLASKAAGDPLVTEFPPGCEGVARRLLANCSGCLLAVRILGTALSEVQKTPQEWAKVEMQFESYLDESRLIPDDYESKSLYAAISLSLYYGRDKASSIGMENVLRALALFDFRPTAFVQRLELLMVELAWNCLQPQGAIGCFDVFLKDLVWKGLVEEVTRFGLIRIHNLVRSFVAVKLEGVNLRTVELKGEVWRDALVFFLALFGEKQVRQDAISLFDPLLVCDAESYMSELFKQMAGMTSTRTFIIDREKAQLSCAWSDFHHVKIRMLADANWQMPEVCYRRDRTYWSDLFNLLLLKTWINKRQRIDNEQEVANVLDLFDKCILEYTSKQLHP